MRVIGEDHPVVIIAIRPDQRISGQRMLPRSFDHKLHGVGSETGVYPVVTAIAIVTIREETGNQQPFRLQGKLHLRQAAVKLRLRYMGQYGLRQHEIEADTEYGQREVVDIAKGRPLQAPQFFTAFEMDAI